MGRSQLVILNKTSPALIFLVVVLNPLSGEHLNVLTGGRNPFSVTIYSTSQAAPGNASASASARKGRLMEFIFFICYLFFFAVDCKFFFWLPINLPVQGRQRFKEPITGQGFLSAHFCRVMHANWFMPTSLAKLLSHIMRSPRRRVSFLQSSAVPGRTGTTGRKWWDANRNAAALRSPECRIGKCRSWLWAIAHVTDGRPAVFPSQRGFLR